MISIDLTNTSTYADLSHYRTSEDYTLEAKEEGGNWETIDRDQAVDDEGDAYYTSYAFPTADQDYRDPPRPSTPSRSSGSPGLGDSPRGGGGHAPLASQRSVPWSNGCGIFPFHRRVASRNRV
jgi:hypothetical protein